MQTLALSLVQGPGWNGEKFNLRGEKKKSLLQLPLRYPASPFSPLHPHLQGRSRRAKPKPDGLIGPKDNK